MPGMADERVCLESPVFPILVTVTLLVEYQRDCGAVYIIFPYTGKDMAVTGMSDHVSWGLEKKGDPDVFKNTSGGPGIETLLPALWTGCEEHGISPTMVVKQLCEGPAKAFLLADKGRLAAGADADIVVLEPGRFIFDPSKSLSAVRWSSFEGREFTVRVATTFVRGTLAWDGSTIRNAAGDGRFLRPAR